MQQTLMRALHAALRRTPPFRGRARMLGFVEANSVVLPSAYGPLMELALQDYTNRVAFRGGYGNALVTLIDTLPPDGLFVDVGANLGIFSLVAARRLTRGRVIAFEPNPFVFTQLVRNVRLNEARNVTPICAGLAMQSGPMALSFSPRHTGSGNTTGHIYAQNEAEHVTAMFLSPAHTPLADPAMRGSRTLVKVDVEGAEVAVLGALAAAGFLDRTDTAFIEISRVQLARFGATVADVYALMVDAGLRPRGAPRDADVYDEIFDRYPA
jgi:FkbM family methyltransferase